MMPKLPLKKEPSKYRALMSILAGLGLTLLCGQAFEYLQIKNVENLEQSQTYRKELLRLSGLNAIKPTLKIAESSPFLFDLRLQPKQSQDWELTPAKPSFTIRLPNPSGSEIKFKCALPRKEKGLLAIRDSSERLIASLSAEDCQHPKQFHVTGPLLKLQAKQTSGPISGTLWTATESKNENEPDLVKINLRLTALEEAQLKMLTSSAKQLASDGKYEFPKSKVKAEMQYLSSVSKVKLGLSGRTPGHFDYPPSLSVQVNAGPAMLGTGSFKLYRIWEKTGLLDFVGLSLLRDFGVITPHQRLVELSINNHYAGLYIFEETYSSSYFENNAINEGRIVGYDLDEFFRNYPFVRLEPKLLYSPERVSKKVAGRDYHFSSEAFTAQIDSQSLSKILAFSVLFAAGHGLGADDFRFYEDPISKRFFPIARDPNVYLWAEDQGDQMVSSHLNWLNQKRPISLFPTVRIEQLLPKLEAKGHAFGLWDVHPAIHSWLSHPEHRRQFEKMLLLGMNYNWRETFKNRLNALTSELRSRTNPQTNLADITKVTDYSTARFKGKIWPDAMIQQSIERGVRLEQVSQQEYWLLNTLPLTLHIESQDPAIKLDCKSPILSPNWGHTAADSSDNRVELYRALYPDKTADTPLCRVSVSKQMHTDIVIQNLSARLANNQAVAIGLNPQNNDSLISTVTTPPPDRLQKKLLMHLLDTTQEPDSVTFRFAFHRTHKSTRLSIPLSRFLKRSHIASETTQTFSNLSSLAPYSTDFTPEALFHLPMDSTQYFSRSTSLTNLRIERTDKNQYVQIDTKALRESLDTEIDTLYFFDPGELVVPETEGPHSTLNRAPPVIPFTLEGNTYRIPEGSRLTLTHGLVIPRGFTLKIEPEVRLQFEERAYLKIEGKLIARGTPLKPIRLTSKTGTWRGLTFDQSLEKNELSHAIIENITVGIQGKFAPLGAINILGSTLKLSHVTFKNLTGEDGINVNRGKLEIRDCKFKDISADAVDADFSSLLIKKTNFRNVHADAVDLNQSNALLTENSFHQIDDKGVSIGEKTIAKLFGNTFKDCQTAIAAKDSSLSWILENHFVANKIAIAEFIKKPWYQLPRVERAHNSFNHNEKDNIDLGFNRY